jgi:hypothetical protein
MLLELRKKLISLVRLTELARIVMGSGAQTSPRATQSNKTHNTTIKCNRMSRKLLKNSFRIEYGWKRACLEVKTTDFEPENLLTQLR